MVRTRLRKFGMLAVAGATALFVAGAGPASATTGTLVAAGSGTISPGLTTTPTFQTSVNFTGTVVVAGAPGAGDYNCTFNGASTIAETEAVGQGSGTLTCTGVVPVGQSFSCSLSYERTGTVVVVRGGCSGSVSGSVTATLAFEPTSVNPTSSYQLQGTGVIA